MKKFVLTIFNSDNTDKYTVMSEYVEDEYIVPLIKQHLKIYNRRDKLDKMSKVITEEEK